MEFFGFLGSMILFKSQNNVFNTSTRQKLHQQLQNTLKQDNNQRTNKRPSKQIRASGRAAWQRDCRNRVDKDPCAERVREQLGSELRRGTASTE